MNMRMQMCVYMHAYSLTRIDRSSDTRICVCVCKCMKSLSVSCWSHQSGLQRLILFSLSLAFSFSSTSSLASTLSNSLSLSLSFSFYSTSLLASTWSNGKLHSHLQHNHILLYHPNTPSSFLFCCQSIGRLCVCVRRSVWERVILCVSVCVCVCVCECESVCMNE